MPDQEPDKEKAMSLGASFISVANFSIENNQLKISIECVSTLDPAVSFSADAEGKLDLDMDSVIQKAVLKLTDNIEKITSEHPEIILKPAREPDEETAPSVENVPGTAESEAEQQIMEDQKETRGSQGEPESGSDINRENVPNKDNEEEPSESTISFSRAGVSIEYSPFMTTGEASRYFTFAQSAGASAGYRIKTVFGYIQAGIYSGMIYFAPEGILISAEGMIIAAGPELRLGVSTGKFAELFLRTSGGPALFLLNPNDEGFQSAVIPFVSGGMGFSIYFAPEFGLAVSVNYNIYMESSVMISGFSPSAGFSFRF